uniref:Uncharacterized protein n=1 Tax=Arundo donax TaxID=35708 RepID=A0A0A8YVM0_ARUDO
MALLQTTLTEKILAAVMVQNYAKINVQWSCWAWGSVARLEQ